MNKPRMRFGKKAKDDSIAVSKYISYVDRGDAIMNRYAFIRLCQNIPKGWDLEVRIIEKKINK